MRFFFSVSTIKYVFQGYMGTQDLLISIKTFSGLSPLYLVAQPCLTLCEPVDCSPPGSSVCGILQARTLEWVAIPSSRGSS